MNSDASSLELRLDVFTATESGFAVNAILVSGQQDAVLIDTGYTKADSLRIAAMVLDSRKTLTTIYISQADPDHFFGTGTMHQLFPEARIIATGPTVRELERSINEKIAYWVPIMGANAPLRPLVPDLISDHTFVLEDHTFEVRGLNDSMPDRSFAWIPSLRAILGGICVFADLHVWTANTTTQTERAACSVS